jgi:hypothetical protein
MNNNNNEIEPFDFAQFDKEDNNNKVCAHIQCVEVEIQSY